MPFKPARTWKETERAGLPAGLLETVAGSDLLAQALWRRGLRSADSARAFIDPRRYSPCPPAELPGLMETVDRLEVAIRAREPICVWGDFDVDGQTATGILVSALRELGAVVSYYIPVRASESHGVNLPRLEQVLAEGVKLVLTCDTGITAHDAAVFAARSGVDFLISDHHELPPSLPAATAIVNPRLLPPDHPLAALPGAGVAYKLAEELYRRAARPERVEDLLDLVALGIVADVAALRDDTRYLLQRGLEALRLARRPALRAMLEFARIDPLHVSEEHIGFALAPRLNALGRLGDANPAVEFFLSSDLPRVRVLAQQLEGLNAERQLKTQQVFKAALAFLEQEPALLQGPAIVLAQPSWPAGIIGIVASRLVEVFGKPVVLLADPEGEPARGSARSVPGINISAAIARVHASQPGLVPTFGGHPMAAGLSLAPGRVEDFRRALWLAVREQAGEALPLPELTIDGELPLSAATLEFAESLEQLAPFGAGNPPLVLAARNLTLRRDALIGRESEHRVMTVEDESGETRRVIWWNGAGSPAPEGKFDLAYTLRATTYNGVREAQLQWIDFQPVEEPAAALPAPGRQVLDYRQVERPLAQLRQQMRQQVRVHPGEMIVWCEGEAKAKLEQAGIPGRYRHELAGCDTLVIWSAPPGRAELRAALEAVKPASILVYAVDPELATAEAFLPRLAGLVKFALKHQSGRASLVALAAATGQREIAVRKGLDWLQAKGFIFWEQPVAGEALISQGTGQEVESSQVLGPQAVSLQTNWMELQVLLEETAAFRAYFQAAAVQDLQILLNN